VFGIDKQLVKIQEMDCLNDGGTNGRNECGWLLDGIQIINTPIETCAFHY
jgi:hypothetical protein